MLDALLTCQSFFSEGRSTVSPRRLVNLARAAGYAAVGLTDWGSVSGAVELSEAAEDAGLSALIGATLPVAFDGGPGPEPFPLVLLARNLDGYAALCELITGARSGQALALTWAQVRDTALRHGGALVCLTGGRRGMPTVLCERRDPARAARLLTELRAVFRAGLYVQLYHGQAPGERRRLALLRGLARDLELPVVAAPEVCMGAADEYALLDALTCARLGLDVGTPHAERPRNDAAHVGTPRDWAALLPFPDAAENARRLARECRFALRPGQLRSPPPALAPGATPQAALEQRAWQAVATRYPGGQQAAARKRLAAELGTVAALDLAGFFLTAAEVTDYCRTHGILAAGRGSAAGSVLCFVLGITLGDPLKHDLLFERFLHGGRASMPDVDIDIASSRRDQVLKWVEDRWGAQGAGEAMVANRVTYRLPSAVQDLGRALGLPPELRDRLTRALGRDYRHHRPHRASEAEAVFTEVLGDAPVKTALLGLLARIEPGFVRHLAPHSGGVVLGDGPLTRSSPLGRSSGGIRMLAFDKDDVEQLGLIKLDLLGLRLLGALERAREEVLRLSGEWVPYGDLPDDPQVWREIAQADTMALFQIESPAQTQMSAKLQPKNLTALAHQIALIRPGPIQSGTVHPYVRRSRGEEPVPELPEPLRSILAPTHGTLMFQEQILRIAVHYAGYSWAGADRFRGRLGKTDDERELDALRSAFVLGAAQTVGAFPDEAEGVFALCAAFRGYGFAESHAHAFAQHCYASAWMRRHHPAAFLAGVLTEAPGMWPAATIASEFRRRGVRLSPLCINRSSLSYRAETAQVVRIPLTALDGLGADTARDIVLERLTGGKFRSVEEVYDRVKLRREQAEALVQAGAFDALPGHRHRREAAYLLHTVANARPGGTRALLGAGAAVPDLSAPDGAELAALDVKTTGLSASGRHPLDAHRARLRDLGCTPLAGLRHGDTVWAAGLVIARQKPPTAKGFAFYVLEDPSGRVQAVISPDLWEAHRQLLRDAPALLAHGAVTRRGLAVTLKVQRLAELPLGRPQAVEAAD